jgi:hypothetical protein
MTWETVHEHSGNGDLIDGDRMDAWASVRGLSIDSQTA